MTERAAPRVVLLARAGEARDRLGEALVAAGAELALAADPVSADPAEAVASRPQAVLVALEPAIEDALERFEPLLSDPGVAVIFEEAELAAQRTGWDAARWVRHLAAKLHHHDDVLPPGSDEGDDLQPSPGALPPLRGDGALDMATFADEAQARADDVPRDDGLEPEVRLDAGAPDDLPLADQAPTDAPTPEPGYDLAAELATHASGDAQAEAGTDTGAGVADASFGEGLALEAMDDDPPSAKKGPAADGAQGDGAEDAGVPDAAHDAGAGDTAPDGGIELVDVDALLASMQAGDRNDNDTTDPAPAPTAPHPGAPSETPPPPRAAADIDLDALEARVSSLSLADTDSYGHGPERGAVLVEGGLGGPDAVRQLLAAIPDGFPRPVLVRLQLDGGRYDRLVKQMGRAAQLPVALAEAGGQADAGTVYFVPPGLSLARERSQLSFVADEDGAHPLLDALPPGDSALLLLSGSSSDSVDAGMTKVAAGLMVAGQALDGCYDATASNALIARGATTAPPAELAQQLSGRWPS